MGHQRTCLVALKWIFLVLFFGFVLLIAVLSGGCGKSEPTKPRQTFTAMAEVRGTSMLPTFSDREIVALELCAWNEIGAGDTIIFWNGISREYNHHRIDRFDHLSGRWITRGDNNGGQDMGRMSRDEFVGRTKKLIRAP
jgi:signal peptidase I